MYATPCRMQMAVDGSEASRGRVLWHKFLLCHAAFPPWLLREPFDRLRTGKRGAWPSLPKQNTWRDVRAPPAISVPARSAAPLTANVAFRGLCAPPARRDRSVPRGTTGQGLPGPMASSAMTRRRRSFPAFERLRSVPGRKDERDYAGGANREAQIFRIFLASHCKDSVISAVGGWFIPGASASRCSVKRTFLRRIMLIEGSHS